MALKESELFEPIKEFFSENGYDIFAEVEIPYAMGRVDVVAYSKPVAIAIELKTSLSIDLIEQAIFRKNSFGYVYIAIPERKSHIAKWVERMLSDNGIGIIYVNMKSNFAYIRRKARYKRPVMRDRIDFSAILKEEHKTWLTGGSSGGGYVTHYKLMVDKVKRHLKAQGDWRTIDDILEFCETHYSSPKPSLSNALRNFESDWCECKKEKGRLHFRYKSIS